MATNTPKLGLRKPSSGDLVNVLTDISNSMDILDNAVIANPNAAIVGTVKMGLGAAGANNSYVSVGAYDASDAIIAAANDLGTNVSLILASKGNGGFILRDSVPNNLMQVMGFGTFGFGIGLIVRHMESGWGASRFDQILCGLPDSGGAGYRTLIIANGP
jgi:hypothetical protein